MVAGNAVYGSADINSNNNPVKIHKGECCARKKIIGNCNFKGYSQ